MIRIPPSIKPGDTIGIAAPSFGATTEPYASRLKNACLQLKNRGYKIIEGECCKKSDGHGISTNPKDAARELMDFYLSPKINAIISCGGGELMCETTGFLDFEKLKSAPPKWFIGCSDKFYLSSGSACRNSRDLRTKCSRIWKALGTKRTRCHRPSGRKNTNSKRLYSFSRPYPYSSRPSFSIYFYP